MLSTFTKSREVKARHPRTWRLGRSAVIVAGAGVVVGLTIFLFLSAPPRPALAVPDPCYPPAPQPGPARSWEVGIDASTYSQVNTRHGNLFTAIPVVGWSGIGPDMNMMLYHNSAAIADGSFAQAVGFNLGPGWSTSYSDRLLLDALPLTNKITLVRADGTLDEFTWNATQQRWLGPPGVHDVIIGVSEDVWQVKHKSQGYHEFRRFVESDAFARLEKIVDATGNAATLAYENYGLPPHTRLKEVWAAKRHIQFKYESGPSDLLTRIFDPQDGSGGVPNRSWTFQYQSGRMSKFTGPRDKPIDLTYYSNGWIATISDRYDSGATAPTWTYNYTDGRATQIYDPAGDGGGLLQEFAFTCYGPSQSERKTITEYTDRRSHEQLYWYPEAAPLAVPMNYGTLQRIEEPAGTQYFNFSGGRDLMWYSDAVYNEWESTYDTRGNQLTLTDSLSHVQTWTYDPLNNLTSYTDAAANTVRYYYDDVAYPTLLTRIVEPSDSANPPPGQLPGQEGTFPVTRVEYYLPGQNSCGTPTGNTLDFEYGCHGQLEEVTDPNGVWSGFSYDQWGQRNWWREGKYTPTTAGPDATNCGGEIDQDSGGFGIGGSSSGGNEGSVENDADGNPISSTCILAVTAGGGSQQNWPPFPLPCNAPDLPNRYAEFSNATYTAWNGFGAKPVRLNDEWNRGHSAEYDVMGRQTHAQVVSDESGVPNVTRTFDYGYNVAAGTYTRTGPDDDVTTVQMDWADHLEYIERKTSSGALLMRADYTHFANGAVESITYRRTNGSGLPGASIHYFYDSANRVTFIEHRNAVGWAMLRMEYSYTANDLPSQIVEKDQLNPVGVWTTRATTTFAYDRRNRLINESRTGQNSYERGYVYDKGGNRTRKYDPDPTDPTEVWYYYDWENAASYESNNNRLMYEELRDSDTLDVISTKYYEYSSDGNITRVITEQSGPPPQQSAMSGGSATSGTAAPTAGPVGTTVGGATPSPSAGEGRGEGTSMLIGGGGSTAYSAVRFVYANNGRAATFVHGESWTWDEISGCPDNYSVDWAREFRYDGGRARYMNRNLHPGEVMQGEIFDLGTVWSDYDGDETYGDFTVAPAFPWTVTSTDKYVPGLWRSLVSGGVSYLHNDHLGTLKRRTNSTGAIITGSATVFTAFGEKITQATSDRFGYVGAFGYQSHSEMPYQHVGARYYDPSSGRFLQRDPIGIAGGPNVFSYTFNIPTAFVDVAGFAPTNPGGAAGHTPAGVRIVVEIVRDMGPMAGDVAKVAGSAAIGVITGVALMDAAERVAKANRLKEQIDALERFKERVKERLEDFTDPASADKLRESLEQAEKLQREYQRRINDLFCG